MTNAELYFAERCTNPAYDRAYQRAWQGLDPEVTVWRSRLRRLQRWIR